MAPSSFLFLTWQRSSALSASITLIEMNFKQPSRGAMPAALQTSSFTAGTCHGQPQPPRLLPEAGLAGQGGGAGAQGQAGR